jgi:hypothetical protein
MIHHLADYNRAVQHAPLLEQLYRRSQAIAEDFVALPKTNAVPPARLHRFLLYRKKQPAKWQAAALG